MKIIITCGPSYEPIDGMRRITNASTGELGLMLAERLCADGHDVTVLKGAMAVSQHPCGNARIVMFSTNDDLLEKLRLLSSGAIFHAAALCDFRVKDARIAGKIPTSAGDLTLALEPTTKVLPQLRTLFPEATIVGWKYELEGKRDAVLAKALSQLRDCQADVCVVNGSAWGSGFGVVRGDGSVVEIASRPELCDCLAKLIVHSSKSP